MTKVTLGRFSVWSIWNDVIKFRSCMLLFNAQCDNKDNPFRKVLIREHWLF